MMVTIDDGNFEETVTQSPDSQQSQLGKADYDVKNCEVRERLLEVCCSYFFVRAEFSNYLITIIITENISKALKYTKLISVSAAQVTNVNDFCFNNFCFSIVQI